MSSMFEAVLGFESHTFTPLPKEILESAKALCRSGKLQIESKNTSPDVPCELPDIAWGKYYAEKVDRLSALFYRLIIDDDSIENGILVHADSANKDRFKIVLLNSEAEIIGEENCMRSRDGKSSYASLYFNACPTYQLGDPQPTTGSMAAKDPLKDPLNVLRRLETFSSSSRIISPGSYLLMVFGDNLFGKSSYRLTAAPLIKEASKVEAVTANDESVLKIRNQIEALRLEFVAAKKAYQAALDKVQAVGVELDNTLDSREDAYRSLIDASVLAAAGVSADVMGLPSQAMQTENKPSIPPPVRSALTVTPRRRPLPPGLARLTPLPAFERRNTPASTDSTPVLSPSAPIADLSAGINPSARPTRSESSSSSTLSSVSSSAAAAGGWLSKTFSSGLNQLQTIVTASPVKTPRSVPGPDTAHPRSIPDSLPVAGSPRPQPFSTTLDEPDSESSRDFDDAALSLLQELGTARTQITDPALMQQQSVAQMMLSNDQMRQSRGERIKQIYPLEEEDADATISVSRHVRHAASSESGLTADDDVDGEGEPEFQEFQTEAAKLLRTLSAGSATFASTTKPTTSLSTEITVSADGHSLQEHVANTDTRHGKTEDEYLGNTDANCENYVLPTPAMSVDDAEEAQVKGDHMAHVKEVETKSDRMTHVPFVDAPLQLASSNAEPTIIAHELTSTDSTVATTSTPSTGEKKGKGKNKSKGHGTGKNNLGGSAGEKPAGDKEKDRSQDDKYLDMIM